MKITLSVLFLVGALASLSNAAFTVTATGNITYSSGTDLPGLNGALFTITTVFEGSTYNSEGGYTAAVGTNALTTLNVSGASTPAFNGSFSHYAGSTAAHYYPTSIDGAGLWGGLSDNYILYFDLGNNYFLGFSLPATATSSGNLATPGATIALSDFSNGSILPLASADHIVFGSGNTPSAYFNVANGTFNSVPEPSAALLSGLAGLALLRRRR